MLDMEDKPPDRAREDSGRHCSQSGGRLAGWLRTVSLNYVVPYWLMGLCINFRGIQSDPIVAAEDLSSMERDLLSSRHLKFQKFCWFRSSSHSGVVGMMFNPLL